MDIEESIQTGGYRGKYTDRWIQREVYRQVDTEGGLQTGGYRGKYTDRWI